MPAALKFARQRSAPAVYDQAMRDEQRRNPETFAVERMSEWSSSALAYLDPLMVKAMFGRWEGRPQEYGSPQLEMQESGRNVMAFYAHGDPSEVNHRFGFSMAHLEVVGEDADLPPEILALRLAGGHKPRIEHHVVFDLIHFWDPAHFEGHHIHYPTIMDWIFDNVVIPFRPKDISFDHYNVPSTVDYLRDEIRTNQHRLLGQSVNVWVRNATRELNWDTAENFKAAVNQGLVHAPWHPEGHDELKYLQKPRDKVVCAPVTGPVTTDDIADTIMITVFKLLDARSLVPKGLVIRPRAGMQHGPDPMQRMSPWSPEEMDAVRGAFSQSRARARGMVPTPGMARAGLPAARGLKPDMIMPKGRRNPLQRWK
jgi:hypothetical protein